MPRAGRVLHGPIVVEDLPARAVLRLEVTLRLQQIVGLVLAGDTQSQHQMRSGECIREVTPLLL